MHLLRHEYHMVGCHHVLPVLWKYGDTLHKPEKLFSLSSPIELAAKKGRIPCCWILHGLCISIVNGDPSHWSVFITNIYLILHVLLTYCTYMLWKNFLFYDSHISLYMQLVSAALGGVYHAPDEEGLRDEWDQYATHSCFAPSVRHEYVRQNHSTKTMYTIAKYQMINLW